MLVWIGIFLSIFFFHYGKLSHTQENRHNNIANVTHTSGCTPCRVPLYIYILSNLCGHVCLRRRSVVLKHDFSCQHSYFFLFFLWTHKWRWRGVVYILCYITSFFTYALCWSTLGKKIYKIFAIMSNYIYCTCRGNGFNFETILLRINFQIVENMGKLHKNRKHNS